MAEYSYTSDGNRETSTYDSKTRTYTYKTYDKEGNIIKERNITRAGKGVNVLTTKRKTSPYKEEQQEQTSPTQPSTADKLIEDNLSYNKQLSSLSSKAKDYKMIKSYDPLQQSMQRVISPQETITTEQGNRLILEPTTTVQKGLEEKEYRTIERVKEIERDYPMGAPTGEYFALQGGLFVSGVGKGFLAGANPLEVAKGIKEVIINPVGTFKQTRESFQYNPAGFWGGTAGSSLSFSGGTKFLQPISSAVKASPFIKGNPKGFRESANLFVQGADYNTMMGKFTMPKGTTKFSYDSSLGLRANTLKTVTGDKYFAQSTLLGEGYISRPITKGFLAREGINLKTGGFKENLAINTGQTKLVPDIIESFPRGRTVNPNVLLSAKSIDATNPTFKVYDFITPSKNGFYTRKTTQQTLFPVAKENKIVGRERNTLYDLYGKKPSVMIKDVTVKPFKAEKGTKKVSKNNEITYSSGNTLGTQQLSNEFFEENIVLPKSNRLSVLEDTRFSSAITAPSLSIKSSFRFKPMIKIDNVIGVKSKSGMRQTLLNTQTPKVANILATEQRSDVMQKQRISQIQKQSLVQFSALKLRTKQVSVTQYPTSYKDSFSSFGTRPITTSKKFAFTSDKVFRSKKFGVKNIVSSKLKFGYFPSVEAGLFNIRGGIPKGFRSGLTLRPLARS